jgi:hypothetical protein
MAEGRAGPDLVGRRKGLKDGAGSGGGAELDVGLADVDDGDGGHAFDRRTDVRS